MRKSRTAALARIRRRADHPPVPAKPSASVSEAVMRNNQALIAWNPRLTAPDPEQRQFNRELGIARARDLTRNEPLAGGWLNRILDMVFGQRGLRFAALPDRVALGITEDEADTLADDIERLFRNWAEDSHFRCDWERDETWGGLCRLIGYHYLREGEAFAVVRWDEVPDLDFLFRASLHVLDPDRVSNPNNKPDDEFVRAGIENNGRMAVAYHIQSAHPAEWTAAATGNNFEWVRVPRYNEGLPQVLHLRRKERAGEWRGWPAFMATLKRFKSLSRFEDAEIESAVERARTAMVITSDRSIGSVEESLGVEDYATYMDASGAFYGPDGMKTTDGTRIARLFGADKLEMVSSNIEGGNFEASTRTFLRHIAAGLGITYEQLTMDWSQVNYSSARAALIENWRSVESLRDLFIDKIARPMLFRLVHDAVESGVLKVPDAMPSLLRNPRAWLNGLWIGPGRGWVDPVKEPTGAAIEMEIGTSTLQEVAARQGSDWQDNARQKKREKRFHEREGIDMPKPYSELRKLEDDSPAQIEDQREAA